MNKYICPFCKRKIETRYYNKYESWICGCFNKDCNIRPMTLGMESEKGAVKEWITSFKEEETK